MRKKYTTRDIIDIIILAIALCIGGKLLTLSVLIPNNIVGITITVLSYMFFLIALIVVIHYIFSRKRRDVH